MKIMTRSAVATVDSRIRHANSRAAWPPLFLLISKSGLAALLTLIGCCLPSVCAAQDGDADVIVKAQKKAGEVLIEAQFWVPATPQETWAVLTDFEHMARFVSNLRTSKVIKKWDDRVRVSQSGKTTHGLLSFSFESVREIDMRPFETIHSRMISGTMQKAEGTTHLLARADGTAVSYHSESIPGAWVPPFVGTTFIETEIRSQFQDMRKEILRRKGIKGIKGGINLRGSAATTGIVVDQSFPEDDS